MGYFTSIFVNDGSVGKGTTRLGSVIESLLIKTNYLFLFQEVENELLYSCLELTPRELNARETTTGDMSEVQQSKIVIIQLVSRKEFAQLIVYRGIER